MYIFMAECGVTLTYWYGTIITPGFPDQNYPHNFICIHISCLTPKIFSIQNQFWTQV